MLSDIVCRKRVKRTMKWFFVIHVTSVSIRYGLQTFRHVKKFDSVLFQRRLYTVYMIAQLSKKLLSILNTFIFGTIYFLYFIGNYDVICVV